MTYPSWNTKKRAGSQKVMGGGGFNWLAGTPARRNVITPEMIEESGKQDFLQSREGQLLDREVALAGRNRRALWPNGIQPTPFNANTPPLPVDPWRVQHAAQPNVGYPEAGMRAQNYWKQQADKRAATDAANEQTRVGLANAPRELTPRGPMGTGERGAWNQFVQDSIAARDNAMAGKPVGSIPVWDAREPKRRGEPVQSSWDMAKGTNVGTKTAALWGLPPDATVADVRRAADAKRFQDKAYNRAAVLEKAWGREAARQQRLGNQVGATPQELAWQTNPSDATFGGAYPELWAQNEQTRMQSDALAGKQVAAERDRVFGSILSANGGDYAAAEQGTEQIMRNRHPFDRANSEPINQYEGQLQALMEAYANDRVGYMREAAKLTGLPSGAASSYWDKMTKQATLDVQGGQPVAQGAQIQSSDKPTQSSTVIDTPPAYDQNNPTGSLNSYYSWFNRNYRKMSPAAQIAAKAELKRRSEAHRKTLSPLMRYSILKF
jgi:hypothetical protein